MPGDPVLVVNVNVIIEHYAKSWLLLDVISALPYYYITRRATESTRLLRLLGLCRLTRLRRTALARKKAATDSLSAVQELGLTLAIFLGLCHVSGCLFWFVSIMSLQDDVDADGPIRWGGGQEWLPALRYATFLPAARFENTGWEDVEGLPVMSWFDCYVYALLWGIYNVSGLMVAKPEDIPQTWLSFAVAILGVVSQAAIIGSITNILQRMNAQENEEKFLHEAMKSYLHHRHVPLDLQRRIQAFYDFSGGISQGSRKEDQMCPGLPKLLRFQLEIFKKRDVFLKVPFFRDCSIPQILDLIPKVSMEFAAPGRFLLREGFQSPGLYMIGQGRLQILVKGKQVAMRYMGEFVGETSLLERTAAGASCITHTWCELMLLRRGDFRTLVKKHPDVLEKVRTFSQHKDDAKLQLSCTKQQAQLYEAHQNEAAKRSESRAKMKAQISKAHVEPRSLSRTRGKHTSKPGDVRESQNDGRESNSDERTSSEGGGFQLAGLGRLPLRNQSAGAQANSSAPQTDTLLAA